MNGMIFRSFRKRTFSIQQKTITVVEDTQKAYLVHGFVHALNVQMVWPSTFFFARHQRDTLSSLSPETRDVAARDSGDK